MQICRVLAIVGEHHGVLAKMVKIDSSHRVFLLLRPLKTTEMTKMTLVTWAKHGLEKACLFCSSEGGRGGVLGCGETLSRHASVTTPLLVR